MLLGGDLEVLGWQQQALAAGTDLAGALLLLSTAGRLQQSRQRAASTATAYVCCAVAALLAGCSSVVASAQHLLLLGALTAALSPTGALLSAVLLAAGSVDWLPGIVLLVVPLAMLSATRSRPTRSSSGATTAVALKSAAVYCCYCAASSAALVQLQGALPPPAAAQLDHWLGLSSWQASLPPAPPTSSSDMADPLGWVGTRASQQPWHQRPALLLPVASLQPGLGLHWYLLAQVFPHFRAYFLYVLQAMPAALMLPLALRFPCQPQLLLATGALLRCLLHPRPVPSMATLCVGLLPLAHAALERVSGLPWHGAAMAAALLLNDSTLQLWLGGHGGNANFLYGMNLLWGGLQVVLLLRMLRAAACAEVTSSGGNDGDRAGASSSSRGGPDGIGAD